MAFVLENIVANALQHLLGLYFDGIEKNRVRALACPLAHRLLACALTALTHFLRTANAPLTRDTHGHS